ncbi:MAG: hypothetical protein KC432_10110, partial [Thermomicrobiales bacterium]|nr:hypothetical protein [Thermomicrobiales bacterium]
MNKNLGPESDQITLAEELRSEDSAETSIARRRHAIRLLGASAVGAFAAIGLHEPVTTAAGKDGKKKRRKNAAKAEKK